MKKVAIASHIASIDGKEYDGIGNTMKRTAESVIGKYVFVRHSMDGRLVSEVQSFKGSKLSGATQLKVISKIGPLRYVTEVFQTVRFFSKSGNRVDVFVGIDPLNALAGILLKKRGYVNEAVFYTADYSPQRFNSKLLNWAYHKIDNYCVRWADQVWSVSTRIVDIRKEMGLPDKRNIFVPNVPPKEYDYLRKNRKNKYRLITYGIIDKQLDFESVFKAIIDLKDEFPKLTFVIIGNGPEEQRLKDLTKKMGIIDKIEFLGKKPLDETLREASVSGIGLALYTGVWGFNYYGDSTKCREYFNFGLPVISTDTHATVQDIVDYNAGLVVTNDVKSISGAIKKIIAKYDNYSTSSALVGKKYSGVHARLLTDLLQ